MLSLIRPAVVSMAFFTLLLGLAYPLLITGVGQAAFPRQANGSLVLEGGKVTLYAGGYDAFERQRAERAAQLAAAKASQDAQRAKLQDYVARNSALLEEAIEWIKAGGQADFTAGETSSGGTAHLMAYAMDKGADSSRMTLSSDAFGSQPRFDTIRRVCGALGVRLVAQPIHA